MATAKVLSFDSAKCKGHLDCTRACSQVHFKSDEGGARSALKIIKGDDGYSIEVCNHCGLCMDMCPVQALKRLKNGNVALNKNLCVECQACVAFCPRGGMRKAPEVMVPFKCISCGKCVEACPEKALELVEVELDEISEIVYHVQGVGH